MKIMNIAIIAHVDHGKTALTDSLMRQTGMFEDGSGMDSDSLEQERGITIYSKNTSIYYQDIKINIVDTPGHADFGSEVERVLLSIDSVVLVVDAQEGPMPQTKFVLKKSLELGLKPIVVINKIDKNAARPKEVEEMVYELFLDLGADDEQLDFSTVYTIAKDGIAKKSLQDGSSDLTPFLDVVTEKIPLSSEEKLKNEPLLIQPFNLAYDNFLGRLAIGRIYKGEIKTGSEVIVKDREGNDRSRRVAKLFTFEGQKRKEVNSASAGDIVIIAGLPNIFIGETICENRDQERLPAINIDEPTISFNLFINDSPFAGKKGKYVTNRQIKERLEKEIEVNVGLKIDFSEPGYYKIQGRGEMHIAILLENMRREGYEIQISQPHVIIKEEDGIKMEPFEEVIINVPEEMSGSVIEKLAARNGTMMEMKKENGNARVVFEIPSRGLLGYRNEFVVDTKGEGIMYSRVIGFKPHTGEIKKRHEGSMISMATGKVLAFSLFNLQDRGTLYIEPNTQVYEGMVIGNTAKGIDMAVNPTKGKQLTNVRASGSDEAITLNPPIKLDIERGIGIMGEDEFLEITPGSVRLRKQHLTENERNRAGKKK
jgi:GTP-binding protein